MKRLLITIMALVSLAATVDAVAAPTMDKTVQGSYTTVAKARENFASYMDGTNILLVNWAHYPVIVDLPTLGKSVVLGSINSGMNTYYAYSPFYYGDVEYFVYDQYTDVQIDDGYIYNPGTLEIQDYIIYGAKKSEQPSPKVKVQVKHGL